MSESGENEIPKYNVATCIVIYDEWEAKVKGEITVETSKGVVKTTAGLGRRLRLEDIRDALHREADHLVDVEIKALGDNSEMIPFLVD